MTFFKLISACLPVMVILQTSISYGYQAEAAAEQRQNLFDNVDIIDLKLEGDIGTLMKDRGDDPSFHEMKLHIVDGDHEESLDLRVRVRGNFRRLRKNCDKPPLKFNFKKHEVPEQSLLAGHPEFKLVVPCKGEKYVIREYLTYKLYNLFTDYSFNVKLVRLSYHDSNKEEITDPQFGFLIEDKEVMASRLNASLIERDNLRPEAVEQESFFRMSVFAYLIGNTDWSVQYLHNIEMLFLNEEKIMVSVPYDFDLVGLVSSPYAKPSPALKLRSVQERVYRGYCLDDLEVLEETFAQFQELKPEIYKTFTGNTLLEEGYVEFVTEYLDDFYETLNDRRKRRRAFSYPCSEYGTGNVVISGMQEG